MPQNPPVLAQIHTRKSILRTGLLAAGGIGGGLALGSRLGSDLTPAEVAAAGTSPVLAPPPVGSLAAANLDFAFRLQNTLLKSIAGQNLFFSPLSITTALAMVYNGAAGSTQKAMAATLAYKTLSQAQINAATYSLLTGLQQRDADIKLNIANSMWLRLGVPVVPAFSATLRSSYSATLQNLDFKSPHAPDTINAWVKQQTHGLIPEIVKSISADTMMFLINAMYFKAAWSVPFGKLATRPAPFTTGAGKQKSVPMMAQTSSFAYRKSATAEVIRLPYATGQFAMYVVLPAANTTLPAFLSRLTPGTWKAFLAGLVPQHGSIQLPKFSVSFGAGLKPALSALGMAQAFDPNSASFPGILAKQRAFITDVQHKAVMKVDENGTQAAAVTSIGVGATAVLIDTFHMIVNRPFFCAIRDEVTGTLLFAGAVEDPS
jgi:serine protease inhibitor